MVQAPKLRFVTFWSLLRYRSTPLQVLVLGNSSCWAEWQAVAQDLAGRRDRPRITFEHVDILANARFQEFRNQYQQSCPGNAIDWAFLARLICHDFLPLKIEKVISLEMGNTLVLDDIRNLWEQFEQFQEEHMFAAPALNHINHGLMLFNVKRMRERNFSVTTLRAAWYGLHQSGYCQNMSVEKTILNLLHVDRDALGYVGPSPMMILPCHWMFIPTTDWQTSWNSPKRWLFDIRVSRRFPGLVSSDHVEAYCPDEVDLLFTKALQKLTEEASLRQAAVNVAQTPHHCTQPGPLFQHPCCQCGLRASVLHIPSDLRKWPFMAALLRRHMKPWAVLSR